MSLLRKVIIGGIYKHYKGDRYVVLHEAKHTETGQELVVYRRCGNVDVWVRSADEFNEHVWIGSVGGFKPRFKYERTCE